MSFIICMGSMSSSDSLPPMLMPIMSVMLMPDSRWSANSSSGARMLCSHASSAVRKAAGSSGVQLFSVANARRSTFQPSPDPDPMNIMAMPSMPPDPMRAISHSRCLVMSKVEITLERSGNSADKVLNRSSSADRMAWLRSRRRFSLSAIMFIMDMGSSSENSMISRSGKLSAQDSR